MLPLVSVNLAAKNFESVPPFDQNFLLSVTGIDSVDSLRVEYGEGYTDSAGSHFWGRTSRLGMRPTSSVDQKQWVFDIHALRPNTRYLFRFEALRYGQAIATLIDTIPVWIVAEAGLTRHFDSDFGIIVGTSPTIGYVGGGSTVHFYFVPINKAAPYGTASGSFRQEVLKRLSVFAGVSLFKIEENVPVDNKYDVGNPIWGLGVRPYLRGARRLDFFRANVGIMHFVQKNANPLITDKRGKHTPFVSVTADLDLQAVLGPLAVFVGKK
jgi:hypothetical protein